MRDSVREHPRLAGARPCDDDQRAFGDRSGALVGVEGGENRGRVGRSFNSSPLLGEVGRAKLRPGEEEDRGIGSLAGRLRRHPLLGGESIRRLPTILVRLPGSSGRIEQKRPALPLLKLTRLEKPDDTVFAVVARFADYFAGAKASDGLRKKRRTSVFNLFDRRRFQNLKLGPEPGERLVVTLRDPL